MAVAAKPTAGPARRAQATKRAVRRAPADIASPESRLSQAEAIADGSGWGWRAAGVRFTVAFHPAACCHWGIYEAATSTVWLGPTAFARPVVLRYVVLHELAHAWQYRTGRIAQLATDFRALGFPDGVAGLEAGADCIAAVWGATLGAYWACPDDARAFAARRLAGDWSGRAPGPAAS